MAVYKKPTIAPPPKGPNGEEYVPIAAMMRRAGRMPTRATTSQKVGSNLISAVNQSEQQPTKKYGENNGLYFVQKPHYKNYTTDELLPYMYVPQQKTYSEIKYYNSVDQMFAKKKTVEVMYEYYAFLKGETNSLPKFHAGEVDLSLIIDQKDVAKFLDTLIEYSQKDVPSGLASEEMLQRYYMQGTNLFEKFYHEANLDINQYLAHSKFGTNKMFRYIEDPCTKILDRTGNYTCLEYLEPKQLQKMITARKLVLTNQQQEKLNLKTFEFKLKSMTMTVPACKLAIILFAHGAIGLTRQEIEKLAQSCEANGIKCTDFDNILNNPDLIEKVETSPFEKGFQQNYDKTTQTEQSQISTQKTNATKEQPVDYASDWEKQEAEDEMDKIFAEAQKNVEMER